jgi:uncharacterized membrane protein (DUF106 family)
MAELEDEPEMPGLKSMATPLLMLVMMSLLLINPKIRTTLATGADKVLTPLIPFSDIWFVLTVGLVGSSIMVVNTIIRSFFMDPIQQAHLGHRNKQMGKLRKEAMQDRDKVRMDKIAKIQQRLMPEQMKLQNAMMRPMMFTFIFIIAIFSWMNLSVEQYRVDYVSLPWAPEWNLLTDKVIIFPAWIATYICLSAPLGRIVDRHIKLIRYKNHPVVTAGEPLPEPLLALLRDDKTASKSQTGSARRASRDGPLKKKGKAVVDEVLRVVGAPPKEGTSCPECDTDSVERAPDGRLRCVICRHTWRR